MKSKKDCTTVATTRVSNEQKTDFFMIAKNVSGVSGPP